MLQSLAAPPPPGAPPALSALPYASLRTLLSGADLSRLLALTAPPGGVADGSAAGGEPPYAPAEGELVVLFVADVDGGAPTIGADVLQRGAGGSGLRTKGLPDE